MAKRQEGGWRAKGKPLQSTPDQPLLTVITVVYNGIECLEQCMNSVLSQTYTPIEYIVVDGASTDGTVTLIEQYSEQLAYWISEPDKGIYNAMNKGLALAQGEVIALLNADDFYYPEALTQVMDAYKASKADVLYGDVCHIQELSNVSLIKRGVPRLDRMKETMTLIHPAVFVTRETYEQVGNFNEQYRIAADYDFLLRAVVAERHFHYVEGSMLTGYRGGGLSAGNCASILEARAIQFSHLGGTEQNLRWKHLRCVFRSKIRQLIYALAQPFGGKERLEKRLLQKWNR